MKFQIDEEDDLHINLTPLIDVVFLLLIFFMVTTTFSRETQLQIELPEATAEKMQSEDNILEIIIDDSGRFAIKAPGAPASRVLISAEPSVVSRALQDAMGDREKLNTVIRADRATPHEYVIRAMDEARKLGLTRITFSTKDPSEG